MDNQVFNTINIGLATNEKNILHLLDKWIGKLNFQTR